MKIFMALMGLDIGGAETHAVELCKQLSKMGHEVTVASNGGAYLSEIENEGVRHIWAPMNLRNPFKIARSFIILLSALAKQRPDVVHAHARIPAFLCGLICRLLCIPFVTSAHGTFTTAYGFKYVTNWGYKTLAVSEDIKRYLVTNYGVRPENVVVSINGVDTDRFSPGTDCSGVIEEFGLAAGAPRITYVSRLNEDVCSIAFLLLEVFEELEKRLKGLELLIVGDGDARERLSAVANGINSRLNRNAVVMTGSRTDVNRFLAPADLCIGVSRAILEGMACAKPVIIAGVQGYMGVFDQHILEQAIENNFTCRGWPKTEKQTLAEDILKVFSLSKGERQQLGEYGRAIVEKYYSVQRMANDNLKLYQEAIRNFKYDAVISGYYGFRNSGDDALLYAMIGSLKERKKDIRLLVLSLSPRETAATYGVESINRFNVFKIIHALRRTKLFINGGGSLIQDATSTKSLLYYLAGIALAKHMGVKVMLYANGIGPVKRGINRSRVKLVLNRADYITIRDMESLEELRSLGVDKPAVKLTADPAFTLKACAKEVAADLLKDIGLKEGERIVCISVRKWPRCPQNLPEIIASAADYIREKYGLAPVLLPMQYPYDASISRAIISKMKTPGFFVDRRLDTNTVLSLISLCDLVLAVRLHTLIYASTLKVPAIGISYDPKVSSFLKYTGQPYYINPSKLEDGSFKGIIDKCMANSEEIKRSLEKVSSDMKLRAEENADIAISLIQAE